MNGWGLVVLLVALAGAVAFGTYRARTDGRVTPAASESRPQSPGEADFATPDRTHTPFGAISKRELGSRATLVQFSTAFCQPCRATRQTLAEVSAAVDGVAVIHVDAEDNLDLVRELNVRRTPTVFLLDKRGLIVHRAVGQPRKVDVIAAIGALG